MHRTGSFIPSLADPDLTGVVDIVLVCLSVYRGHGGGPRPRAAIMIALTDGFDYDHCSCGTRLESACVLLSFIVILGWLLSYCFNRRFGALGANGSKKVWPARADFGVPKRCEIMIAGGAVRGREEPAAPDHLEREIACARLVERERYGCAHFTRPPADHFQTGLPLNDGAVIIQKDRSAALPALPLDNQSRPSRKLGTRPSRGHRHHRRDGLPFACGIRRDGRSRWRRPGNWAGQFPH